MSSFELEVAETARWLASPRFEGITRLYSARPVVEQRGTIQADYMVARTAAEQFYDRLRELFAQRKQIPTFGPYSPGQAVALKRVGIEAIYLGGWATSAKGSVAEDPGPDLASYPLSQVPDEAAPIVRALLTADRNQRFARSRMSEAQRAASPEVDYRPFIIADADTGHGGDAHVRNLVRRFVEVGVPGYHIEDQKPGAKKCGHQGGKVLVAEDEQIKRLNAARLQLDIMRVPGIIVARTDAESATFLENRSDERDQPFILGATNIELPSYKVGYLAILRKLFELGVEEIRGHLLFAVSEAEYLATFAWLERVGLMSMIAESAQAFKDAMATELDAALDRIDTRYMEIWQAEAGLKTYGLAVAEVMESRTVEGERFHMTVEEWLAFSKRASFYEARERAKSMGIQLIWNCELPKTPEGFYQIQAGIDYAIVKSLAVAPFADVLWMETKTADLEDARKFAHAIHAEYPDKMLAYNLSPSFNWDTTATKTMGKGSTQFQHLVQTEVPTKLLEEWLTEWGKHFDHPAKIRVELRPHTAGSELLELRVLNEPGREKLANVVFSNIQDRRGRNILSIRDQNTLAPLRKKRLMTLVQLFLIHRYNASSVHYVTPTEDNQLQTQKMKSIGIFSDVHTEIGQIIVANVSKQRVAELLKPDRETLLAMIQKTSPALQIPA